MATAPERIASLEAFKSHHTTLFWWMVAVAGGWLVAISIALYGIHADVRALAQELKDMRVKDAVQNLQNATTREELATSLPPISSLLTPSKGHASA